MSKKILVVYPRAIDLAHIPRLQAFEHYEFMFERFSLDAIYKRGHHTSEDLPAYNRSQIEAILEQTSGYDGIITSNEYPGSLISALCAEKWNMKAPSVKSILSCQHKYMMRKITCQVVPEATPEFHLIDPQNPYIENGKFPLFIKPIRSSFSRHAYVINSQEQLEQICAREFFDPQYLMFFNELFSEHLGIDCDANFLIGETLLEGHQVSLEGYVQDGTVTILGIVDAGMYEGTISFERFTYPSKLPHAIQERMGSIARKAVTALGLDHTVFSVELMYNPDTETISIIEINPRMSSQFADFFEQVDGINSYELVIALALGHPTQKPSKGAYTHAGSFPLRIQQDHYVAHVPTEEDLKKCSEQFPGALITIVAQKGQFLSDLRQDSESYLYALINCAAHSQEELEETRDAIAALLHFGFEPVQ